MARGVRKTALERLQEELISTRENIGQYENQLQTLKEKEIELVSQVEIEELRLLSGVMKEQNVSISELKEMIMQRQSD